MFVGSYFLVGGGSFGARTVAISRQTASAAFDADLRLIAPVRRERVLGERERQPDRDLLGR